jgi:hypothetical protein
VNICAELYPFFEWIVSDGSKFISDRNFISFLQFEMLENVCHSFTVALDFCGVLSLFFFYCHR